jgi:cytoskeletal protein CcmA (bactofilin family)
MAEESMAESGTVGRSHLGPGSRITGVLYFPETVELPGHVKGRVEAATIVIEDSGEVDGELHAISIEIKGRFKGQISGGDVRLRPTARVVADITYERLTIDSGAELEGQCKTQPYKKAAGPT